MQLNELTVTNDPRIRMKEIRSFVNHCVKTNQRLDLVDFNHDDQNRVIIALQDALDNSQQRHKRATTVISKYKDQMKKMGDVSNMLINTTSTDLFDLQNRVAELSEALRTERESHMQTSMALDEEAARNAQLDNQLTAMQTTLKTVMS